MNNILSDVDDGLLYQKIKNEMPSCCYLCAMTLNTDGANIFKSSNDSLWPVQLVLNCLPPSLRYLPENIIISTLYYGRKPFMNDLLYILSVEIDHLNEQLITIYKDHEFFNFVPKLLLCACDLPARDKVQNFKGPNGKFGCSICYHPGIPIANNKGRTTIRFTKHESTLKLRTHDETVEHAQRVAVKGFANDGKMNTFGIKGHSAILLFDDINVIDSFPIDVMHGVALGLTKDMVEIWLGTKPIPNPPYKDYKIKSTNFRRILNNQIMNLRPTSAFKRMPRSIFDIAHYKASELFNLLCFF